MYPGVRFEIASLGTDDITAAVLAGDADVGITFQATPTPNIQVVTRIVDPLLAIVAPKHPMSQFKSIDFREVLAFPMALPGPAFGIRKVIDAFCTVEGIALQPSLETNSIEGLRGFARAGIGVSALHYLGVSRDIDQGSVIGIPFSNAPLRKSLVEICVLNGRQLPIAAERFIEHLRRELNKKRKA
jgi:DNA-binding transcriptional LysR family regulator